MIFAYKTGIGIEVVLNIVTIRITLETTLPQEKVLQQQIESSMANDLIKANLISTQFKGVPYYEEEGAKLARSHSLMATSSYIFPSPAVAHQYAAELKKSLT